MFCFARFLPKFSTINIYKKRNFGNFLSAQWLGLLALIAEGLGSFPGRGAKIRSPSRPVCPHPEKRETFKNKLLRMKASERWYTVPK